MGSQPITQTLVSNFGPQNMDFQEHTGVNGGGGGGQSWPQRALDEMKDMYLLLRTDGGILYASPSCKSITGYITQEFEGRQLADFAHADDRTMLTEELEQCVATGSSLQLHFRINQASGSFCILEVVGHPHVSGESGGDGEEKKHCDGFFLICRPYLTKSSQLLDSFLEHKIENIRLTQQVARLKEEEEEELQASRQQQQQTQLSKPNTNTLIPFNAQQRRFIPSDPSSNVGGSSSSIPDIAPSTTDEYDTPNNIAGLDDSELPTPPFPTDGLSHIEGIEVITGLHYGEGERAQGISTGARHGRLIQCDPADMTTLTTLDQQAKNLEQQEGDRRKRVKGEYHCTDCGTSDSPEWRKGPMGPKSLCNACGLRWAKKKRNMPT